MSAPYPNHSEEETIALALNVVAWALSDQTRAERMLSLTGLDPQTLRENLTKPATLRAMLDFVLDHEPDLMACAREIGVDPAKIAAARRTIGMSRPLIVSDCDEVLLHMVVPFRSWLDEYHDIHFDFSSSFEEALRHKDSGDVVERVHLWRLLGGFFETEMHRQGPISGAVEAMTALADRADIVIVTNIGEENAAARAAQLHAAGLPFRVIGNRGGKGPAVAQLIAAYRPSLTIFIDDLESNHSSVGADVPQVWRLQLVGEPEIAPFASIAADAHARIDDWDTARRWIEGKLDELDGVAALMEASG